MNDNLTIARKLLASFSKRVAIRRCSLSHPTIFISTVIWLLTAYPVGEGAILDILEYVSLFGLLVGFPLLGVATFRARVLPRWCGVLLVALPAVFLLVFSLLEYSGAARALFGPYWLALGYALWSERGAPIRQPSPVN
jgi:hypothetical protein